MAEPQHIGKPVSCRRCGAKGQVTITTMPAAPPSPGAVSISYLSPGFDGAIVDGRPTIACACGAKVWP